MRRLLVAALFVTACGGPSGPDPIGTPAVFRGAYLFSVAPSASCGPGFGSTLTWSVTATTGADGLAVVVDSTQQLRATLAVLGQLVSGDVRAVGAGDVWIQSGTLAGELGVAGDGRAQVRPGSGTYRGSVEVGDNRCGAADHRWSLTEQ